MIEASKIRAEQSLIHKMEGLKKEKEDEIHKESRIILKKEREARKLEILEAEVLKRLRDTHLKQQ